MTKQEYALWAQQESPRSRGPVNILKAFLFGGAVCAIGQLLIFFFEGRGAGELAPVFASLCLVVLSAILTGLNVYDDIAKHAGAGTLVPITGFANSMVSAAMEFKTEGYILGLGAKIFSIAGPVIVYGISASVIYGILLFLLGYGVKEWQNESEPKPCSSPPRPACWALPRWGPKRRRRARWQTISTISPTTPPSAKKPGKRPRH